ncbi:uncharacterized protein RAG0_02285 [Rhynchosporium agropyri]|uniref:WSC domain-containing protein n=1 Tax=Rhynchosporium agropyri TaxID=914238 RepID=A0A1E1K0W9_9HELO|nr:uncharacterized protein RAG0_02285 [Rhynchosporium agropyri]
MKISFLLSLVELAILSGTASCTDYPLLPNDPATTSDCADWYNNFDNQSCLWVRDYFKATPEEFKRWNPSVGLDCKPWYDWTSYCIITWTKFNASQTTTTSSKTTTVPTSTALVLGPSPTAWTDMGCYVEEPKQPLLDININPNGDASLSIPKCWQACYRRFYQYAGVQNGNQCWCGSYVGGEWATNQTDCNSPCTGNTKTFCGGPSLTQIFKAQANVPIVSSTTSSVKVTSTKA